MSPEDWRWERRVEHMLCPFNGRSAQAGSQQIKLGEDLTVRSCSPTGENRPAFLRDISHLLHWPKGIISSHSLEMAICVPINRNLILLKLLRFFKQAWTQGGIKHHKTDEEGKFYVEQGAGLIFLWKRIYSCQGPQIQQLPTNSMILV